MRASAAPPGGAYGGSYSGENTSQVIPFSAHEDGSRGWDGNEVVLTSGGDDLLGMAAAPASAEITEMGDGTSSCEYVEDANSDVSEPWIEDGECVAADVITSASAHWCAHEMAIDAEADPLASFFAQLISSHSLVEGPSGADGKAASNQPYTQATPSDCTYIPTPQTEETCGKAGAAGIAGEGREAAKAVEPQGARRREGNRAGSGSRRAPTQFTGSTIADSLDPEMRAYFAASIRRKDVPHILGSVRAVIASNPEIFGFFDVESSSEAEAAGGRPLVGPPLSRRGACLSARQGRPTGQHQQQQQPAAICAAAQASEEYDNMTHGRCQLGAQDTTEWLFPPAVPVCSEFCRVNPRVAVHWLVQTQMESMLDGGLWQQNDQHQAVGTRQCDRLDEISWAHLACLVPPKALCNKLAAVVNPAREKMELAAPRLAKGLSSEQTGALRYLLQAWYFSGYFAGQLQMTAGGS